MGEHLNRFLEGYDSGQALDEATNDRLLLKLRWLINDFIYIRLKLHRGWKEDRFLDLFDVIAVKTTRDGVELTGDIVWWSEGRGANLSWVPADHESNPTSVYKVKIRGDMRGGHWVLEPVIAKLEKATTRRRYGGYSVKFGRGSTYMKIKGK